MLSESKDQHFNTFLVMIDLDNFKTINDLYGHSKGDQILVEISHIIKESVKDIDVLARYGGDEFILLLAKKKSFVFENWKSFLEEKISKLSDQNKFPVSVSVGKSNQVIPFNTNLEKSRLEADSFLYKVKKRAIIKFFKFCLIYFFC